MNANSENMNGGRMGQEQESATTPIFNIRKSDLVRVIIQALQSLHYSESAKLLEQESGIQLHSPEVEKLKDHIAQGDWDMALQCIMLILDQEPSTLQAEESTLGGGGDEQNRMRKREITFLVLREKYLEHLLHGRIKEALHCLRNEISPLFPIGSSSSSPAIASDTLHRLSSLIMCRDPQQLIRITYNWNWWRTPAADMTIDSSSNDNMANGTTTKIAARARMPDRDTFINQCRHELLDQLHEYLPSSFIVPENHLQRLLLQQFSTQVTSGTKTNILSPDGISLFGRANRLASDSGLLPAYGLRSGTSSSTPPSNVDTFFSNVVMSHVLEDHLDEVWNLSFSPNGRYLATCSADKTIILYDLQKLDQERSRVDDTQAPTSRYSPYVCRGHTDTVTHIEWSPDSTKLLSCSNDHTIKLWKLPRQGIDRRRNLNGDAASSSSNGSADESSRDGNHSLNYSRSFNKHKDAVASVVWLSDCKHFISCGGGKNDKSIRLWNIRQHGSSSMINRWKLNVVIYDMAITPDGCKIIVLTHQKNMHVYYADTPEALLEMFSQRNTPPSELESTTKSGVYILSSLDYLTSIAISPCGRYVLGNTHREDDVNARQSQEDADTVKSIQEGALHLWDLNQRKMVSEFTGHAQSHYVLHPSFGSNNRDPLNWRYVLSGSEDGRVCVWERSGGDILQSFDAHSGSVNSVAWNWHYTFEGEDVKSKRTAHLFASASDDMTVRLFSANCI